MHRQTAGVQPVADPPVSVPSEPARAIHAKTDEENLGQNLPKDPASKQEAKAIREETDLITDDPTTANQSLGNAARNARTVQNPAKNHRNDAQKRRATILPRSS